MSHHAITRVRHEPRRRLLTVQRVERITPGMARVTLGGDLAGFLSSSYDDHVKVFFPLPGDSKPTLPDPAANGAAADGAPRSPGRDYTPRRYDLERNELILDFALHEAGPATDWATRAAPGHQLAVGGPPGSFVVTDDFDGIVRGDEPPCPRLAGGWRPAPTRAIVAAVTGPEEQWRLSARPRSRPWVKVLMPDSAPLLDARAESPEGRRRLLLSRVNRRPPSCGTPHGFDKAWVKAAGY